VAASFPAASSAARSLGLLARDGCIEWPHRPARVPGRLAGHEEIRAHLAKAAATPMRWDQFTDLTVYETTDPEVVAEGSRGLRLVEELAVR
jgi:hypothetical protein